MDFLGITLIEPEAYDACVEQGLREDLSGSLFLGVDVGLKSDSTAIVAVKYDRNTNNLVVAGHRIWQPQPGKILDLGSTLEFFIRGLSQRATIVKLLYDPSQAQRSMQLLQEMMWSETIEEFTQTQNNLSAATQTVYDYLTNKKLRIYQPRISEATCSMRRPRKQSDFSGSRKRIRSERSMRAWRSALRF